MSRNVKWPFLLIILALFLVACAAGGNQAGGDQPPAEQAGQTAGTATAVLSTDPASLPTAVPLATPFIPGNLRPIPVDNVQVQVGVGSPIPVDIFVSGTWPDLCAQIAQINQRFTTNQIEVDLLATPSDPNCPPDFLGLPFRIAIPVNVVELAEGSYTVVVNGIAGQALTIPLAPPAPMSTEAPADDPNLVAFEAQLQQAVTARDFPQMQALMGDPFTIAGWRSEGANYPPAAAIEQLQLSYIGPATPLAFQPIPEAMGPGVPEFQGMFGPDVNVAKMLYTTGWGLEGTDEALLYIARRPDGSLYWHGVLAALGGFTDAGAPPPAAGEALPTDVQFVMAQQDVAMYDGPSNTAVVIGQVFGGQTASVTGVSADGLWWRVLCPDGTTGSCWVSADPTMTQPAAAPGG
jgi:hypothetical protein